MQSSDWIFNNVPQDIGLRLSSFCSKHLTSNRCISGLPCPIAMQFLSSENTFQALHLVVAFEAIKTTLKVEKQS